MWVRTTSNKTARYVRNVFAFNSLLFVDFSATNFVTSDCTRQFPKGGRDFSAEHIVYNVEKIVWLLQQKNPAVFVLVVSPTDRRTT
eukprot:SAG31_NODE_15187_length_766_cov_1.380810_1_plen_86_part_00